MNRPLFFSKRPVLAVLSLIAPAAGAELCMSTDAGQTQLSFCAGAPFHSTAAAVGDARLIEVPDSTVVLVLWNETPQGGSSMPYYAAAFDGQNVSTVETTSYELRLRYAHFDPAVQSPQVDGKYGSRAMGI